MGCANSRLSARIVSLGTTQPGHTGFIALLYPVPVRTQQRRIPAWFDYGAVSGLSREMQEKLGHVVPQTLGQASRIPGVTPAAVSLINVYIEIQGRRREQAAAL